MTSPQPQPLKSDDRTWALVAYLGALAGFVFGMGTLGWFVPLIIWLWKRKESDYIAFHALQELLYQLACMAILAVGWSVTSALCAVLIGFFMIPPMLALSLAPVIWPIYAAVRANRGEWYQYPVVGEWARANVVGM